MKTTIQKLPTTLALLALLTLNLQLSTAYAQGSLTPPGAPAPTMKSLDQIEPRTPISFAPFTISASGSYYLTTNVTVNSGSAIIISANNVTLDLSGFTISSTKPVANTFDSAILINVSVTNIFIQNGQISSGVTNTANGVVYSGSGFGNGIHTLFTSYNERVKDVSVSGVLVDGIGLSAGGYSTVVASCTVNEAGNVGISADSVSDSTANNCGFQAIAATTAQNCCASSSGTGTGLIATTANNCYVTANGSGIGLQAYVAIGCYGQSATGVAISATIANSCYVGGGKTNISYKYNMP